MSEFVRTRAIPQFYRDVFTRLIDLPEVDTMPARVVAEIFSFKSADLEHLEPMIAAAKTGLDSEKDSALKNMLLAITLANRVYECDEQGEPKKLPAELCAQMTEYIVAALKANNNTDYIVAAIQVLFRVNEISSALFLINNNLSLVSDSGPVLKMLLLVCLMEEDYNQAMVVIQVLASDAALIGEDPLTLLMISCAIYKLGGLPDSFIDFRTLDGNTSSHDGGGEYTWILEKESKENTTVLIACDKRDYFIYALPLVFSVYETNRGVLDVHLHLYNPDDEVKDSVIALRQQLAELHISATLEHVPEFKNMALQYSARRTIFLAYALRQFATPLISMNADLLVRKPWVSPGTPLLLLQNDASPFWETIFSGFFYAEQGTVTQRYFDIVTRFIGNNLKDEAYPLCLEQVALIVSLDRLSATEQLVISRVAQNTVLDVSNQDDVFCWLSSDKGKVGESSQKYKAALIKKYQR